MTDPTQAETVLTREQVVEYLKKDYCNLGAILIGTVSGQTQEWTMMKPELIKLVSENAALKQQLAAATQERDKYKMEALVKFDYQVCSGALEAENKRLQAQLQALAAAVNDERSWATGSDQWRAASAKMYDLAGKAALKGKGEGT
jgi:hypothetical protein